MLINLYTTSTLDVCTSATFWCTRCVYFHLLVHQMCVPPPSGAPDVFTYVQLRLSCVTAVSLLSPTLCVSEATAVNIDGVDASYTPLKGPVYPSNTWTYDGR